MKCSASIEDNGSFHSSFSYVQLVEPSMETSVEATTEAPTTSTQASMKVGGISHKRCLYYSHRSLHGINAKAHGSFYRMCTRGSSHYFHEDSTTTFMREVEDSVMASSKSANFPRCFGRNLNYTL